MSLAKYLADVKKLLLNNAAHLPALAVEEEHEFKTQA